MATTRNVIITCAVTGAIHTPTMSPHLPITPEQIASSAVEAAKAGASILHLHARDPESGCPTPNPEVFFQFLGNIKSQTDAVINITTGGSTKMTLEDRLAYPLLAKPEMCSLNMGSMNFSIHPAARKIKDWKYDWEKGYVEGTEDIIFRNTFRDIKKILLDLGEGCGTKFEFECYDLGHLYNLKFFLDEGLVKPPIFLQSIYGILGGMGGDVGEGADAERAHFGRRLEHAEVRPGDERGAGHLPGVDIARAGHHHPRESVGLQRRRRVLDAHLDRGAGDHGRVAVEVRIVSLAESFFERMGLDFSVNIKTDTTKFEPALATGQFRPAPFINDINNKGVTVGLTPAGTFTPDLDVPIRATSFQRAIPAFGNYPNSPGDNGGISLGLAFLNDIQVYTFLEMAQGDMRSNIMQAPKLTLFNGQTATLAVTDQQFFVTSVSVLAGQNGQIVFVPNNTPLSGPDTNFNIAIQAVVSADRRFVRLNLPVNLSAQSGASVPLFPVTTFITPVFEGGSQGQPIPFTQFLQQPSFTSLNIQTTVVCPDGGTVLLGGLKTVRENRNEFGPPFLSKIPYLNRLFKNVGVGRDTRHIMIMVTPRIIINAEEEIFQTEGGRGLGAGGNP